VVLRFGGCDGRRPLLGAIDVPDSDCLVIRSATGAVLEPMSDERPDLARRALNPELLADADALFG
jgi:hypothetical protein